MGFCCHEVLSLGNWECLPVFIALHKNASVVYLQVDMKKEGEKSVVLRSQLFLLIQPCFTYKDINLLVIKLLDLIHSWLQRVLIGHVQEQNLNVRVSSWLPELNGRLFTKGGIAAGVDDLLPLRCKFPAHFSIEASRSSSLSVLRFDQAWVLSVTIKFSDPLSDVHAWTHRSDESIPYLWYFLLLYALYHFQPEHHMFGNLQQLRSYDHHIS